MVTTGRVALPRPRGHELLRLARLLIPPCGHRKSRAENGQTLPTVPFRCGCFGPLRFPKALVARAGVEPADCGFRDRRFYQQKLPGSGSGGSDGCCPRDLPVDNRARCCCATEPHGIAGRVCTADLRLRKAPLSLAELQRSGDRTRIRTSGLRLRTPALCLLSYAVRVQ
jgi:hypothetical protein